MKRRVKAAYIQPEVRFTARQVDGHLDLAPADFLSGDAMVKRAENWVDDEADIAADDTEARLSELETWAQTEEASRGSEMAAEEAARIAADSALTTSLAGKAALSHSHVIADTTGLQAALDGKGNVLLGVVTVGQNGLVAAGVRKVTVAQAAVVTTGNYLAFPTASTPAGYAVGDCVCATNGQLEITINGPLLSVGVSYSFQCRIVQVLT